jgi:hypothetical protein
MLEMLTLFWPFSSHIPIFIPVILQKYGYFTLFMLKYITHGLLSSSFLLSIRAPKFVNSQQMSLRDRRIALKGLHILIMAYLKTVYVSFTLKMLCKLISNRIEKC